MLRWACLAVTMGVVALPATASAGFGSLSLVSVNSAGTGPGNGGSSDAAGSADGSTVVFISDASDLVPGDANAATDVFARDLRTGATTLVSRSTGGPSASGDDQSFSPVVSDDGRYVAFQSEAANLVPGQADVNDKADIFLRDNLTGSTALVSHTAAVGQATTAAGASDVPTISADGRYVAFRSFNRLLAGQTGATATDGSYYLWDRNDGSLALVNHTPGQPANGAASSGLGQPVVTADGRHVAYPAASSAIAPGAGSGGDVFLYDVATGVNKVVSHAATGPTTAADASSFSSPAVSADGRYVLYDSSASNLVTGQNDVAFDPGNPNDQFISDAFLYDAATDSSVLVSHVPGDPLQATNDIINFNGALTRDGSRAAWQSEAPGIVSGPDTNGGADVFLYDRASGTNQLVSHTADSATTAASTPTDSRLSFSADGRYVGYSSLASNLVPGFVDADGTLRDAYAFDSATGANILLSHSLGSPSTTGNSQSDVDGFIGQTVLMESSSTDVVPGDTSGSQDVWAGSNLAPSPAFTVDRDRGAAPLAVGFSSAGADADGTVTSFAWDFGDGASAGGASVRHVFAAPGDYTVTLTVTDDSGATATAQRTIAATLFPRPSLSSLVNALAKKVAGPCHRRLSTSFAVLACGGNKRGKPDLRVYVVNAGAGALAVKIRASELLPQNAAAARRAHYRGRTVTVATGASRGVKLKAPRGLRRALAKALRAHRRVVRRPVITFSATGVKSTSFTHRVVVRRPRRGR